MILTSMRTETTQLQDRWPRIPKEIPRPKGQTQKGTRAVVTVRNRRSNLLTTGRRYEDIARFSEPKTTTATRTDR